MMLNYGYVLQGTTTSTDKMVTGDNVHFY